jgi:hypothetical protein
MDIAMRWYKHLSDLKLNRHDSKKLQNHYNKYGKNDLVFSILIGCDEDDLISIEQFYIDSIGPWFNNRLIAESNRGFKWSEESKKRVRGISRGKGLKRSTEARENIRKSKIGNKNALGTKRSEKFKENLRIIKTGNKHGIGNKSRTGQKRSEAELIKARKPLSQETKNKMKGRIPWNKGKTGMYSEETIRMMSGDNNGMRKKLLLNKSA